ncbi:MAG: HD-like signal output (HDOD) protein [Oceanicoccus sp.]|jgi:HD-like signal output (HDOD) protein
MDQQKLSIISHQLEQRIKIKALDLPMLPQVTSQVLSLVNDVDSDAVALAKLIQSDQALAGHVMRIANSAAYSPNTKMTSLQQAIARLGMQNITEIAMAATMGPKLFSAVGYEDLVKEIWATSLATAVWAREIARQGRRNVESTFLCGLLGQIGLPVVLQAVLDITEQDDISLDRELLLALMQQYKAEVGAVLADHWMLPVAVKDTIIGLDAEQVEASVDIVKTVKAALEFSAYTLSERQYDEAALGANSYIIDINLYAEDVQQLLQKAGLVHDTISSLSL